MSNQLSQLKPQNVFHYFEELCSIPHGSRNTKAISDYCVSFAQKQGLEVFQDENDNVIIKKPASKGKENLPGVILQGHLDMVCEKEADVEFNFEQDPLNLKVVDDYVSATGTTLGGDDGIAVAMILSILADPDLEHPPLEAILTADEEIGMVGAQALDLSGIQGKHLINIDSEEEGIITVGCAGGLTGQAVFAKDLTDFSGIRSELEITGLAGGHSGTQIQLGHANANKLLGRLLFVLRKQNIDFGIIEIQGGAKDNAIARDAQAVLVLPEEETAHAAEVIRQCAVEIKEEYHSADPDIVIDFNVQEPYSGPVWSFSLAERIIYLLFTTPYGVCSMCADFPDLVESSLNLGILYTDEEEITLTWSVRSNVESKKQLICDQLMYMTEMMGGEFYVSGIYPAWPYQPDSQLLHQAVTTFQELYGHKPVVNTIHAGLECGLFSEKMPGVDMISIGPDILDIHTPKERLSISSTKRTYEYVLALLGSFSS